MFKNNSPQVLSSQENAINFWIATYPLFEAFLYIFPYADESEEKKVLVKLSFFDPDGACINNMQFEMNDFKPQKFNLDMFLGSCKLECGIRHGVLSLTASSKVACICQAISMEGMVVLSELKTRNRSAFVSLSCTANSFSLIPTINITSNPLELSCRLICASNEQEQKIIIPPYGTKILTPEMSFFKFLSKNGTRNAYLKLTADAEFAVQQISCNVKENANEYVAVC